MPQPTSASDINATYTVELDGTMHVTHRECGNTQTVPPLVELSDGRVGYGSDADFCLSCESAGKSALLIY